MAGWMQEDNVHVQWNEVKDEIIVTLVDSEQKMKLGSKEGENLSRILDYILKRDELC